VPLTPMPFGRLLIGRSLADVAAYMKCRPQKVPTATSGNSAIDDDPTGCECIDQIAGQGAPMAITSCECVIGRAKGRRRLMSVPVIGGGW
jgi:hypothetical protein